MMHDHITSLQKTGSAHRSCQDRYRVERDEDRTVLIAADGHGGRPYTRSGLGARFACAAAAAALSFGMDGEVLLAAMKDKYDAMVEKHMAFRPLEDWELERLEGRPHREVYGTTLMAAVLTAGSTLLIQLGDGEIHAIKRDGTFFPRLPDDDACRGNLTTSLCGSRADTLYSFRMVRYDEPAAAVMMFTDGCEGGMLKAAAALADLPGLEDHLNGMLRSTNHGDDQTFLLAYDGAAVEDEAFRAHFTDILQAMQARVKNEKQAEREREEYTQLRTYLNLALKKARWMDQKNDPQLEAFLRKLKPSYERYLQLQERLEARKGG